MIQIVSSKEYQNCLINNVEFSKLCFLDNPNSEKSLFYTNYKDKKSIINNNIIKNSYLFMKDEHAHFFLFLNPKTKKYEGTVFKIDSSGLIDFIGNNPFNFLTDKKELNIQIYGINTEKLIEDIKATFGIQNFSLNYDDIDDIYELIDSFYK